MATTTNLSPVRAKEFSKKTYENHGSKHHDIHTIKYERTTTIHTPSTAWRVLKRYLIDICEKNTKDGRHVAELHKFEICVRDDFRNAYPRSCKYNPY